MRKPEIQALVSLIICRLQIRLLLFRTHASPNSLSFLIRVHVIHLRSNEHHKVPRTYRDQHLITSPIQWLIVVSVDVLADNTTSLYCHIVQCRSHGARAYGPGIARCDCDENGVDIGVADEESRKNPPRPR
jgi:hypothetical protein